MYTACPACKTVYAVGAAQLRAAGGRVRCGACGAVFEAVGAVYDDPREAREHAERQLREVGREIDDLVERALDQVGDGDRVTGEPPPKVEAGTPAQATAATPPPAGGVLSPAAAAPAADFDTYANPVAAEFVSPGQQASVLSPGPLFDELPPPARTSWGAIAAALLLTLLLVGQYLWSERETLAANATFRPALESACAALGCELPLRRDTRRLEIVEREIRAHPHVSGALLVNVTFVNRAGFPQPYPVFQLSFSDVSGNPVAMRRFLPREYLAGTVPGRGIPPGGETRLMLEIVDPGERAVSFQFDFL